jgi:DtxR family Mn-dependent transcriptional regulator
MMAARRQANGNSESVDNYLQAILALSGSEERRVASTLLAERLQVAPASITNMLQKLAAAAEPLVEYERHRGVKLSPTGKRRALEVLRHHRLIETFLYKILDYPIEEVHDEAERLEHFISERFEERIAAKLGHPRIDPHGHFIPTMEGKMPKQASIRLTDVVEGGTFVIDSVNDRNARTLRLLEAAGIKAGAKLKVKPRTAAQGYSVSIGRSSKALDITREVAAEIRIIP